MVFSSADVQDYLSTAPDLEVILDSSFKAAFLGTYQKLSMHVKIGNETSGLFFLPDHCLAASQMCQLSPVHWIKAFDGSTSALRS